MKVDITARHMDLSEALEQHIRAGLDGLTHYFGRLLGATVVIDHVRHSFSVEIQIKISGAVLMATSEADDAYVACDSTLSKLQRQLTETKEKRSRAKSRERGNEAEPPTETFDEEEEA